MDLVRHVTSIPFGLNNEPLFAETFTSLHPTASMEDREKVRRTFTLTIKDCNWAPIAQITVSIWDTDMPGRVTVTNLTETVDAPR